MPPYLERAIATAARQFVGQKVEAVHFVLVSWQVHLDFERLQIPQLDRRVLRGTREHTTVTAPC